jgi:CRISPR/Cas system-associated exonuclease Cas4 (RecB family)
MVDFWYIKDFEKERQGKIGASDIPALFANPEKPGESLAGYGRTPLTVWQEKTGRLQRDPPGLAAEMGHFLENKALELFIRQFDDNMNGHYFLEKKVKNDFIKSEYKSFYGYHFEAQFYKNRMIVHPDLVNVPGDYLGKKAGAVNIKGIKVDFRKPFIVEAKSCTSRASKRPEGSQITGYDFNLTDWKGIPLKHYLQVQFQLAMFEVEVAYLALIYDTSNFHVWRIDAHPERQKKIMRVARQMVKHIQEDRPPKKMIFNSIDIKHLYPQINNDFITVDKENQAAIEEIRENYKQACTMIKTGEKTKAEALREISKILEDSQELRDQSGVIARWQSRKGRETISLKDLKEKAPKLYKKIKSNGIIKEAAGSRSVIIY